MTRDYTAEAVEGVADAWRREAEKRRALTRTDPVADTLDYCAGEIAARLRTIAIDTELLSVEAFAALPDIGVTPQTVRTWIRTGQLDAVETARGYRVRRDARRLRRSA